MAYPKIPTLHLIVLKKCTFQPFMCLDLSRKQMGNSSAHRRIPRESICLSVGSKPVSTLNSGGPFQIKGPNKNQTTPTFSQTGPPTWTSGVNNRACVPTLYSNCIEPGCWSSVSKTAQTRTLFALHGTSWTVCGFVPGSVFVNRRWLTKTQMYGQCMDRSL